MKEIAILLLDYQAALSALAQSTAAMLLALLAAVLCRRNASAKEAVLTIGMCCAMVCPLLSFALGWLDVAPPSAVEIASISTTGAQTIEVTETPLLVLDVDGVALLDDSPSRQSLMIAHDSESRATVVYVIWLVGVFAGGWGAVRSWWKIRQVIRRSTSIDQAAVKAAARRIRCQLGLKRFPRIRKSAEVSCPLVAGTLRPTILLPARLCEQLDPDQLHAVLIHEVAHVLRKDHVFVLLEGAFAVLFWPHPVAHWLRRSRARAREEVCDNYVLQWVDGVSYSETLLWLARRCWGKPLIGSGARAGGVGIEGMGLFGSAWKLEHRIAGLLDQRRKTMIRASLSLKLTFVALVSLVVLPLGAVQVVAQRADEEAVSKAKSDPPQVGAPTPEPDAQPVAAYVNEDVITQNELVKFLIEKHGANAVENLIHRKIIEQACREKGVQVTHAEIDAEVKRTAKKFGLSVKKWREMLARERELSFDQYRRDIVWPSLALRKLAGDQDAGGYFQTLKARAKVKPSPSLVSPQIASAEPVGTRRIAIVDIAKVFKTSSEFTRRRELLKKEVEEKERFIRERREDISALQRAIKAITGNEEAKKQLEALVAKKRSELETAMRKSREEMLNREAAAYHEVYREIRQTIQEYAKEHNIDLVLRSNSQPSKKLSESADKAKFDAKDRQALLQKINQHIIYVRHGESDRVDITEAILERLEGKRKRRR